MLLLFPVRQQLWKWFRATKNDPLPFSCVRELLHNPKWYTALGNSWQFGWESEFRSKKSLKKTHNFGQLLGYSHFGRSWRPNCWHQVNFGVTLKSFGYNGSMSYVEGRWYQNCTSLTIFFTGRTRRLEKKVNFRRMLHTPKSSLGIPFGNWTTKRPYALTIPNMYAKGVWHTFLSALFTPKVGWCRQNTIHLQKDEL